MRESTSEEREVRAARNQAMFRAVNEKLVSLNDAFESVTGSLTIACECADTTCLAMVEIHPDEYQAVRAEPRRFVVEPGHVYPDVEIVVEETDGFVVVEKIAKAGDVAEVVA